MNALLSYLNPFAKKVTLTSKPAPEPERLRPAGRPMTGFMATLTPAQRQAALAYRGSDHLGDPALKLATTSAS
jgi:hypothetical protein